MPLSQLLASICASWYQRSLLQTVANWEALTTLEPVLAHDGIVVALLMAMRRGVVDGRWAREVIHAYLSLNCVVGLKTSISWLHEALRIDLAEVAIFSCLELGPQQ